MIYITLPCGARALSTNRLFMRYSSHFFAFFAEAGDLPTSFEGVGVLRFTGVVDEVFCFVGDFDVDAFASAPPASSTTRFLCKFIIFVKTWNPSWI